MGFFDTLSSPKGRAKGRLIRPYMAYATELPLQKFRCEDMLY